MAVRQRKPTRLSDIPDKPVAANPQYSAPVEFVVERSTKERTYIPIRVVTTLEDVMDRGSKFIAQAAEQEYIRQKQDWLRQHPSASDTAYEQACQRIAKALGI